MEQALPAAMIIGTLVDPMATLLNANGDLISAMLVARIAEGKSGFLKSTCINHVPYVCSITKACFYLTITRITVV
jgi:hypothetical protein